MEQRILEGFIRVKRKDYKSAGTLSSEKRRKIQSRNRHLRTCHRRSIISRTGRKIETNSLSVQDFATSGKKLQNL